MSDNTTRFSDRVEDYIKYRPHYPEVILSWLEANYGFSASWEVADIGSGTGISTELFLRHGNRVFAVEPNTEMREAAERLLGGYGGKFVSVDGTAEATGLAADSVQLIVAGQAFHWFDAAKSRAEFLRILRPKGVVALIWNERLVDSVFEKEYDALILEYGNDYKTVDHRNIDNVKIGGFFAPASHVLKQFPNEQWFDFEGLKGRLLSSSYMPKSGSGYVPMLRDLQQLFQRHQQGGRVRVGYDTKIYSGVLKP
ncbi:MAG TPA: class I SAM-dependent methyltransferase [Puia sp.]|nr:class I SAM-dependent methyltransferase [Puia sp.]